MNTAEEKSDWTMFDWTDEAGRKTILQIRDRQPDDARVHFSIAVIIEWRYGSVGLPDEATMERIYRLEEALGAIRNEQSAIHVHTLTGGGSREWCYYTADYAAFEARFTDVVVDLPEMPIEISFQTDQKWDYWKGIKGTAWGTAREEV